MSAPAWICVALVALGGLFCLYLPLVTDEGFKKTDVTVGLFLLALAAWAAIGATT